MRALLLLAAFHGAGCSHDWESLSAANGGGGDGGGGGECGFTFASNIDPCALVETGSDWTIAEDDETLDVDAAGTGEQVEQLDDDRAAWAIHVRSFTVEQGRTLTITGALPLIVVVDGAVTIDGTILVENGADLGECDAALPGGAGDNRCGGGGGGGGFAATGGDGGTCPDGEDAQTPAAGGPLAADVALTPMRGGCSGAEGGTYDTTEVMVAAGGAGGGGLQIIAGDRITLGPGGGIDAAGQGGRAGSRALFDELSGGGGGGGSGGGVFLEAPVLILDEESLVCASGGGGGSGGNADGSDDDGTPGEKGACLDQRADGGVAVGDAGAGGKGGTSGILSGESGAPASSGLASGGGGGGAAGIIRVRAGNDPTIPSAWSPMPEGP